MDFLIKPWAHQLKAIQNAAQLPYYGLFFEQGAGKTSTAINISRIKFAENKKLLRTIVFGPPIVVNNWKDEWGMHSKIDPRDVVPLVGSQTKRLALFKKHSFRPENGTPEVLGNKIFLTNYESLGMLHLFENFIKWQPELLIFDESHRLKNFKAKRSKLAEELANPIRTKRPYSYILSGTPILNSPLDIFQQFLILDGGQTFGRNYFAFRARYFRDRNAGMPKERYFPKWEVMTFEKDNFDALGEISKLMASCSMRVEKKDCMDLPPEIHQIVKVGMTDEQAKLYKEMKNDFITFMGDKACTATIAITKALRLMQISSGFLSVKGTDTAELCEAIPIKKTPKQEALQTMLEDLCEHSKVLVWCTWKENYKDVKEVCDKLGLKYVEVHGGISPNKKQENIVQFKTDPEVKVFIGHPGSGGIGINLVVAPFSIFYSRTFSLEHFLQAKARNHRGGSEIHEKITHYSLVCEGTIDELVVRKLQEKIEISDKVLGDLACELQSIDP